ncbi:MFS transporter [Belnapia sp. T18]|uniref:MFS transporter n=1 Tax=Belnapia arida TaxID=2804533 RepID=A0ABS1UBU7_9PROT|nr:MFS transporter [Belnapia arida]MBL6082156.1 MFS transporter [Belnapia arida]
MSSSSPGAGSTAPTLTAIAWPAILSLSLGVFGFVTSEFLPASLLTPMARDLETSVGMAGQSVTATAFIAALAGPGVVIGTTRFNRRTILLALTVSLIVSSILAGSASDISGLIASRILLGVGLGGFWAMSIALVIRLSPPGSEARAMAVIMTGVSMATVSAAPLGAWISSTLSWRLAFYLTGAVGIMALVAQLATVPSLPAQGSTSLSTLGAALRRPAIRRSLYSTFCIAGGHYAAFTYVRPFLETISRFDAASLSLLLLAFGIAGFFGNMLGGAISQRNSRIAIATAATGIAIAMVAAVLGGTSHVVAAAATVLWGLAFGAYPVSIQTFLTQAAPNDAESAGAVHLCVFMTAVSFGAILGGVLVDRFGPVNTFALAGVTTLLGAALIAAGKPIPAPSGNRSI